MRQREINGRTYYFDSEWGSKVKATERARSIWWQHKCSTAVRKVPNKQKWIVWVDKRPTKHATAFRQRK